MKNVRQKHKTVLTDEHKAQLSKPRNPNLNVRKKDKDKFHRLHRKWQQAVGFWAKLDILKEDSTYNDIRETYTDKTLARLILDFIQTEPSAMILLLPELTGHEMDYTVEEESNPNLMAQKWLKWGRENGF